MLKFLKGVYLEKENLNKFLIIGVITIFVYLNSIFNPFIWDDLSLIKENYLIKNLKNFFIFFKTDLYKGVNSTSTFYRPLQALSYALIYRFFKLSPIPYHLLNIFLHTGCAILIFVLLRDIYGEKISFFVSLLWAIHPVNTEAITYISGTADPLFLFFGLLGIYFYNKNFKILSYFSFIISLLSKETSVLILPIFFLYQYCSYRLNKNQIKNYIIITLIFLIYFILRQTILNFGKAVPEDIFLHRFYTSFKSFLIYISILLFPFILSMERHIPYIKTFKDIDFIAGFIFFLAFLYFLWRKRDDRKILFGGTLFLINFIFHSNTIIPLNGNLREHWMYLGSTGFFIYFIILLEKIKKEKLKIALTIIIFSLYGVRTISRNYDWKDPENFYLKSIKYFPNSPKLWNNLGTVYYEKNMYDKAIECFKKSFSISNISIKPLLGLCKSYFMAGNYNEAEKYCQVVLKRNPKDATAYLVLGLIYKKKGDYKRGFEYLLTSIKFDPYISTTYYFLGKWCLEMNDYKNAEKFFEKGIIIDPSESLNFNGLGIVNLEYRKNYNYALYLFKKAYSIKKDEPSYLFNIGKTYQILNNHKEAILWYERGLSLQPNNPQVLNDLAISYAIIGEKEKAITLLKEAIRIDKNFKIAVENLKEIEKKK
jgi:tetratricopeptide (TPR) repeat protein